MQWQVALKTDRDTGDGKSFDQEKATTDSRSTAAEVEEEKKNLVGRG